MTEIVIKTIEKFGCLLFCAVDNHTQKKGRSYQVIYSAETKKELENFLIEKGITERLFTVFIYSGILLNLYSIKLFLL